MTRSILVLFALAAFAAPVSAEPLKIFVLAGQSNMFGRARLDEFPDELEPSLFNANVPYYRPFQSPGFKTLRPISSKFGPEIGFGNAMDSAGIGRVAIVKHAEGSTSLGGDWLPRTGQHYLDLLTHVDDAITEWTSQGFEPEIAGVLWYQGEQDARVSAFAPDYADNFRTLVGNLREDLSAPNVPFIYARILSLNDGYPFAGDIRSAQEQIAAENIPGVRMILTDDLAIEPDNIHIATAGTIPLGERFADAYLAVPEPSALRLLLLALAIIPFKTGVVRQPRRR